MRRVQGQAIVCGRFVPALLCGKRAGAGAAGGAGAAAGCASGAGRRGRCGPGNGERAGAPAASAEAAESVRLGDAGEAGQRAARRHQRLTAPPLLSSGYPRVHRLPAFLSPARYMFVFSRTCIFLFLKLLSLFLYPHHKSLSSLRPRFRSPTPFSISILPPPSTTSGAPRLGATTIRNQAFCSWFGEGPRVGGCRVGGVSHVHTHSPELRICWRFASQPRQTLWVNDLEVPQSSISSCREPPLWRLNDS